MDQQGSALEGLERAASRHGWRDALAFGGGGRDFRLTESTTTAVCVILAWTIGWTVIGAWRMNTRDA